MASEFCTCHPQTNAQSWPERSSHGQRSGHPPSYPHVMPVPSKARDFVSQGRVHPISIAAWLACQLLYTRTPREGIGKQGLNPCFILNPLDGLWHSLSPWLYWCDEGHRSRLMSLYFLTTPFSVRRQPFGPHCGHKRD